VNRNEPDSYRDTASTYLAKDTDRGLGNIEFFRHRAISAFSTASSEAARTLLHKAQRALDDRDTERARAYVMRAVQLPFDEAEGVLPVTWEAHMLLFTAVTDALEESDEDDAAWLDAALDVLASAGTVGRSAMASALSDVPSDFEVTRQEEKRLRRAIAGIPPETEPFDRGSSPDERAEYVLEVVRTTNAYQDALDELLT
jgi:hypothetical protein